MAVPGGDGARGLGQCKARGPWRGEQGDAQRNPKKYFSVTVVPPKPTEAGTAWHKLTPEAESKTPAELLAHGAVLPESGNWEKSWGLSPNKSGLWRWAVGNFKRKIKSEKNMKLPAALLIEAKENSVERRGAVTPCIKGNVCCCPI